MFLEMGLSLKLNVLCLCLKTIFLSLIVKSLGYLLKADKIK